MVASVAIEPLVATACARCVATDASGEASAGEGKRQALEDLVPMHGRPQRVSATGTRVMPPKAPSHTSSPSSRRPGVVGPETVIVNRADRPGARRTARGRTLTRCEVNPRAVTEKYSARGPMLVTVRTAVVCRADSRSELVLRSARRWVRRARRQARAGTSSARCAAGARLGRAPEPWASADEPRTGRAAVTTTD